VLKAEDPEPLPGSAAELKVFVPGAKPADPQAADPADPKFNLLFYRIEDQAAVGATAGAKSGPVLLKEIIVVPTYTSASRNPTVTC